MEKNMKKNESIEIKRILDILKSKKILIAFVLIVFAILGSVYSYHYVVPKYKSTSTLLLIPNTISEDRTVTNLELMINSELINTYSNIATNPKVLRKTIDNLGLNMNEKQLLDSMQVNILENTYIIEISVSNTDPEKAMNITKELSNVFLDEIKEIYSLNNIGVVDEAELPMQPYNVNHIKDIILFLAMGIMGIFAYIIIIYIFDNTLKQDDVENYIHVKNLGSIPIYNNKKQEIIDRDDAKSYITECINTIRTNILYMNAAKNAKTILITSCTPQEGKSWVSANIATSFAKINKKVLLIDADMRKGRADKIFKVSNKKGLSNYLHAMTGNVKKDIILGKNYIKETQIPNLHILTNGTVPPNPSELLGSNNMKELIAILKNVYDIIIVDAPPCKLVTDSIVLSTIIDSTVLVTNTEKTKINDLNEVKKSIEGVGGEIIGAILNKKKTKQEAYSESYHYGNEAQTKVIEAPEKEIISVNRVLKRAIIKLEKTEFNIFPEENKVIENIEENVPLVEEDKNNEDIKKFIQKQNHYLAKMVNTVSDMKVQLNSDRKQSKLENKNNKNKMEKLIRIKLKELQKENNNIDYTKELNKILNRLEEVKKNNPTSEQMKEIVKEEISKLKNTKQEDLTKEEIKGIIKREISSLKDLEQEKLTKEEIKDIIRKEISSLEDLGQEKLTKEEMQEIIRKEILSLENKEEDKLTKGQVRKIIRKELSNLRDIEQQKLETIKNREDNEQQITEQIAQINDMLVNLQDSYLELSNKLQSNNMGMQEEMSEIDNKNIIDFKALKKTKNKKKKAYSIEEDILYEELEKTATYVVPIEEKKDSDSSDEEYQNTMP